MQSAHRRSCWPGLVGITGHHITQHGSSLTQWDLRIEFRDGGAVTVDGISLEQALAFIDCAHRMLIHEAPDQLGPELPRIVPTLLQDLAQDAGINPAAPQPPEDEPPTDPSDAPRTDPPSTGPQPAAAQEPLATGGWVPPHAQQVVIREGECVLPHAWLDGPWPAAAASGGPQFELRFDTTAAATHVWPQVVHVKPGETISLACSCQIIAGGTLADDPNCQMHHGASIVYVFDGR